MESTGQVRFSPPRATPKMWEHAFDFLGIGLYPTRPRSPPPPALDQDLAQDRLCRSWGVGQSVKRKNEFRSGASRGICDKVTKERDQVMQEAKERANQLPSRALELFGRKERASRHYAESIGIRFCSTRTRGVAGDAYGAGYQAGSQLDLSGKAAPRALPGART